MKKYCSVTDHYDALVRENDDPARDAPHLREYMNRWDGEPFLRALALSSTESVLEIGVGTGRLALRAALAPRLLPPCEYSLIPAPELTILHWRTAGDAEKERRIEICLPVKKN